MSPDLREMMANDPSGNTRVDTIIQAKDADSAVLRSLLASGQASVSDRIGNSDTLVVNLPLSAVSALSTSGTINYVSPDREMRGTGHVEDTTGTTAMRSQPALNGRAAYTLDGTGVGIAVVDSGIYPNHKAFKDGAASRVVANVNFTNSANTADLYGHGSHVAGLALGSSEELRHTAGSPRTPR
ncbi:MAG: S8 family serine peptidase [Acidobacteria bacterium]|nr:S8 family serine peptidase [Acidobacteriota bacterium]